MTEAANTEHNANLARALTVLLEAIDRHEMNGGDGTIQATPFRLMTMSELSDSIDRGDALIRDPIGYSLREGIRKVGKLLAKTNTIDEMLTIAESITNDRNHGSWISIIDANWNGITDRKGATWWS